MSESVKGRLGDRLIESGVLREEQLEVALNEQKRAHRPLGEILVSLGFIRPEHMAELLADDLGIRFARARDIRPDPLLVSAVDAEFVRSSGALPIAMKDGQLEVAMLDPGNPSRVAEVRSRFPYPLEFVLITAGDLEILLRRYLFDRQGQVASLFGSERSEMRAFGDDFPVERVTHALLVDGVHRAATDIHIEPEEKVTRVRYRIDGILQQGENLPRDATEAIISRIKVISRLDIAERRRPQDGRLRVNIDSHEIDMRVSIMPCTHGENVVLRVLDRSAGALRLAQLGVPPDLQRVLKRITERPHGLFLVTGPTGSGKTTTLYAMLGEVDAVQRNVATVEDPVEYAMPLLRQSQTDASIGYGFQAGLRSLLRQDPDVILVGEIRDEETAQMAIKASMTGHLVLSTLHTNSAIGAVPRLCDLGIDPFLIEDGLIGAMAQRLVRKVCEGCAEAVVLDGKELEWLDGEPGLPRVGRGCDNCNGSGFSGRTALCEIFLPDEDTAELIRKGAEVSELRKLASAKGLRTMTDDGKDKVRSGMTTMAEIERVNKGHRLTSEEREDV